MDVFLRAHREVEFDRDLNDRQVDLLVEGFDLAVRIADLQDTTLIARRLATVRHVVCVGPAYMAGHGIPPSPAELTGHACLVYANAPTPGLREYVDTAGREGRVQVRAHLPANNGDCLRQVAEDGYGIVMGPSFILYQSIEGEDCPRSSRTTGGQLFTPMRSIRAPDICPDGCAPYWDGCLDGDDNPSPWPDRDRDLRRRCTPTGFARSREPWGYRQRPSPPRA